MHLKIIHFNDAHDILEKKDEPVGGASRFHTALQQELKDNDTLVLFSGDLFSPSKLSYYFKGEQAIYPINQMGIACACLGNHEFDFSLDRSQQLLDQTNFPWLLSNVTDKTTGKPLGNAKEFLILKKNSFKIGLMGLAEPAWLGQLHLNEKNLIYKDFCETASLWTKYFKEQDCNLIIALTHMRCPNDLLLAKNNPEIDLILGGHDHIVFLEQVGNTLIAKSGSDFQYYHRIEIVPKSQHQNSLNHTYHLQNYEINLTLQEITKQFLPNQKIADYLETFNQKLSDALSSEIECDLRTDFQFIRKEESPIGQFLSDLMRIRFKVDIGFINSGAIRANCLIKKGALKIEDIYKLIPFEDHIVHFPVSGKILYQILENSVSQYPNLDGRFGNFSGVIFTFDPELPPFERITKESILINGEKLDLDKKYTLAMKAFQASGKDGFPIIPQEWIINIETKVLIQTVVLEFFDLRTNYLKLLNNEIKDELEKEFHQNKLKQFGELIAGYKKINEETYIEIKPQLQHTMTIIKQ